MSNFKSKNEKIKIKVGLKVKCVDSSGEEGIVREVYLHNPNNPIEEHGMIEVEITNPCNSTYLRIGNKEHYVEYNWDKFLKVI